MNNLDWGGVEDEKDKRIRELEDTLRKQKELMEILQVALQCFHHDQSIIFIFLFFSGKCSWQKITTNPILSKNLTRSQTFEHIFGNLGRNGDLANSFVHIQITLIK